MEAGIAEIEAHGAERIGKGIGFRRKNFGALAGFAGDDHGGGAIAEKNRRNEIGLGNVFALKGERRKFDGNDQNVPARVGLDEIRGAGQGHGSGGAAEFGEGHTAHVGTKTQLIDHVRVERRNHEASAGDRDDEVDVFGLHAGALKAFLRWLQTQA